MNKSFTSQIIKDNPLTSMLLGLCPILVITDTFIKSLIMGCCLCLVIVISVLSISLIRKLIPSEIRLPIFILVIATYVTIIERLVLTFLPQSYSSLGIVISMITVNCLVLGKIESVGYKQSVSKAFLESLSNGIGFIIICSLMGLLREIISQGGLKIYNPFNNQEIFSFYPFKNFNIPLFSTSFGAFTILSLIILIKKLYFKEKK